MEREGEEKREGSGGRKQGMREEEERWKEGRGSEGVVPFDSPFTNMMLVGD